MNTNRSNTGWLVAGILAIVVVVLLFIMWRQWDREQHDLGNVINEGQEDIASARAEIREKCTGPAGVNARDCQDALNEVSDIIREFSDDLADATTSDSMKP